MRQRHEKDQPHIGDRGFGMDESLQAKGEDDRRPETGATADRAAVPRQKSRPPSAPPRRALGNRAANGFSPKTRIARDLEPIGERRLIEPIAIVEIRHDIIAALDHLARGLGETRLIAVDQGQRPGAGEMKKQTSAEESREIASCRLQESDSKMARAERQPANSRCIKSRRSGNGCSSSCSRSSRSRRRFISTAQCEHWVIEHSNRSDETIHAQRQPLRRLAGARRSPVCCLVAIACVAREQTLGAHWPNDDPRLRSRWHCRTRAEDRDRPRPPVGQTRTRLERPAAESEIQFFPQRTHRCDDGIFRRALFRQPPSCALLCCRSRCSSPRRACMSRRIICRMWFALRSSGFCALGFASGPASDRKSSAKASGMAPSSPPVSCAQAKVFRAPIPAMETGTKFGSSLHYHFNFMIFARDLSHSTRRSAI